MAARVPKTTGPKSVPAKSVAEPKGARRVAATKPTKAAASRPDALAMSEAASETPAKAGSKGDAAGTIKLRNLVDTVATATGAKKPEAKKMVEAVLQALGAGLAARSVLVVPPLGKLRVAKANGSVLTLKLRLSDAAQGAGLALADDDEDS